ncbi:hypothetical protein [Streptomyces longwoodensis]|uniref:hypothetical protein n=1 Tax=Streptomyces longwoodensis TaxID=68231 RepID=UPI0036FC8265
MTWQLHVRFQEMDLRDAYWDEVNRLPQVRPRLAAHTLRTRLFLARPVALLESEERDTLAILLRYTLDFWKSAEVSLSRASHPLYPVSDTAEVTLDSEVPVSTPGQPVGCQAPDYAGN